MKLIRWSPLEEMSILRDQIDRIFEPMVPNGDSRKLSVNIPVEVTETPACYRVRAMIPGLDPARVELNVSEKTLCLAGEASPRELDADETVHLNEFQYGRFTKKLAFPEAIDQERVEATYAFGILEITLPKARDTRSRTIEIKVKHAQD